MRKTSFASLIVASCLALAFLTAPRAEATCSTVTKTTGDGTFTGTVCLDFSRGTGTLTINGTATPTTGDPVNVDVSANINVSLVNWKLVFTISGTVLITDAIDGTTILDESFTITDTSLTLLIQTIAGEVVNLCLSH